MRITTRIAVGLIAVVGLFVGVLLYQLSTVGQLQKINQELSLTNMEAARVSVRILQGLEGVREFALKSWALGDPDYARQWEFWEAAVEDDFRTLAAAGLSGTEEAVRERVEEGWREYEQAARVLREDPTGPVDVVDDALLRVQEEVRGFIAVNDSAVAGRAQASAAAGQRARSVSWIATGTAILLAALLSFLLYRSISGPLRNLTRGTRELAEGRFDHRLAVDGPAELSALARDFNRMAARLDELEDLKRDFVSHVSHELKTPLAAIHETVEALLDELPGPLWPKQVRLLESARRSSTRLSSMIGDLLEISRLEAGGGGFRPERHNLVRITGGVLEEMEPLAVERELTLSPPSSLPDADLVCDGERTREVVANLVDNAIKFSPVGGRVELRLAQVGAAPDGVPGRQLPRLARERGPFLLLSVADQGPGIPDQEKELVFEKFHQAGRTGQARGTGVGLGLAISRRIVDAHSGAIWVEDAPGGGAQFHVLLPRIPSQWSSLSLDKKSQRTPDPGAEPVSTVEEPDLIRARAMGRGALVVLLSASLGACAGLPGFGGGGSAPPPSVVEVEVEDEPATVDSTAVGGASGVSPMLSEARTLLEAGELEAAAERYREILNGAEGPDELRAEALWMLGLLHLMPESPEHAPDQARGYLDAAAEEFPGTLPGIQAEWARDLLSELESTRTRAEEQEALLGELRETLERLRQIDLERTPSGRPPPPDSVLGGPSSFRR